MVHIQSFLIGSGVSALSFLLIHEQLSHRSRLSRWWPLGERAIIETRALGAKLRESTGANKLVSQTRTVSSTWNNGVESVKESLSHESVSKVWNGGIKKVKDMLGKKD